MRLKVLDELAGRLDHRDHAILESLEKFRLLSSRHLQRLHFADHASDRAAARACSRCLQRLHELGLVAPLVRRVGGARKGSASFVWHLAATGERLLRTVRGDTRRRRFVEPGGAFVAHTLAVNDVGVGLLEASRRVAGYAVESMGSEPGNWRRYLGSSGEMRWLKPDLHVISSRIDRGEEAEFEEHAFLEIDLGTEHLPRIRAKCQMYVDFAATGRYQAAHEVFPSVVWLSQDKRRRSALQSAIDAIQSSGRGLLPGLFRVSSFEDYLREATGSH